AKKPVVGCSRGAIPYVVRDNVDGILVQYQDERSLANAIADLLNHPQKAAAMAEEGYQKTAQRYTWTRIAQNYRRVYETILNA
ncbi:MAG TPA: glycosyltransferase, partial [Anaerolineaceae bacterium]|nr:glycosyltransferase [Anaerolineaceae bacterium]